MSVESNNPNNNQNNNTKIGNNIIQESKNGSVKRRHTGAGILIITSYNGKPYFLLGREEYKSVKYSNNITIPVYEEFGGGIQSKKCSLEENALKELDEETSHVLNWTSPDILLKKGFIHIDVPFMENRKYRIYLVYVHNVKNIIPDFFRNRQIIKEHTSTYYKRKNYIEMDDMQLVSINDVYKSIKNKKINQLNLFNDKILKLQNKDIYISRRLFDFLDGTYTINNTTKSGIQYCYQVFNNFTIDINKINNTNTNTNTRNIQGIYNISNKNKYSYIKLKKPEKTHNHKYNFLKNTITYDAI